MDSSKREVKRVPRVGAEQTQQQSEEQGVARPHYKPPLPPPLCHSEP